MCSRIVILYLLVFCRQTSSQPISDDPNNERQTRQLEFGECCPCPGSISGQERHGADQLTRASAVDDCPCRLRDADSEGAPSLFFPTAMRPDRPFMKANDLKEESKNLLQPEVGLASSVLETLREATEEEYQDALARDAARMAVEADESLIKDATPEESVRNIVTIILKPEVASDREDELISEASHVQESRCIQPLGSPSLSKMKLSASKQPNLYNDILRLPKSRPPGLLHRNLLDMDSYVAASNVEERIADHTDDIQRYKLHPPLLKQYSPKSNILKGGIDDLTRSKVPYYTPASILERLNEPLERRSNLFESFSLPVIPRRRVGGRHKSENTNNDLSPAPNNVQEFQSDSISTKVKEFPKFTKRPINLKNLLKLREVELFPPRNVATKVIAESSMSKLGSSPFLNQDNSTNTNNCEDEIKEAKPIKKLQYAPKETKLSPNIRDLVTGPSNTGFRDSKQISNDCKSEVIEPKQSAEEENLDTVPAPSDLFSLITPNSNNVESDVIVPEENLIEQLGYCDTSTESNDNSEEPETITQTAPNEEMQDENLNEVILIVVDEEKTDAEEEEADDIQIDQTRAESKEHDKIHDCFENTAANGDQESAGTDNNEIAAIPQEQNKSLDSEIEINDTEEEPRNQDKSTTKFRDTENESNENSQRHTATTEITKIKRLPPLSETLSSIKENVLKKIGNYQKPSKMLQQDILRSAEDHNDLKEAIHSIKNDVVSDSECLSKELVQTKTSLEPSSSKNAEEDSDSVSFQDLQTLSDSILNESMNKDESAKCLNNFEIGSDESHVAENITTVDLSSSNAKEEYVVSDKNTENSAEKSCPSNSNTSDSIEDKELNLKSNSQPNEMTAEASNPFINTAPGEFMNPFKSNNLRSSLLRDIIVQPPSLSNGDFNLFGRPVNEIFNLNTKLPTLDDLRLRLANIFNTDERSAEDESASIETDCTNNSPRNFGPVMSTDASTSNFMSKLAPLKPLEDINIDIFQLKPLTSTKSDWLTSPRLKLNSYTAKLPIPKNLDLKPLKLESTLGSKSGILGASITTGPKRVGSSPRNKPATVLNPLENLPNLDDLRDSLRVNTKDLLNSPLQDTNVFKDSLRSNPTISSLSENLRSHAESAISNIQQTMGTTLKEGKVNDFNILGDSKNPQEIMELVSRTHDDFNDKLRGLHYDLNDRLTTMHDNLLDQSKIMTIKRPIIKEISNRNSNNKLLTPRRGAFTTSKQSQVQSLVSRKESQKKDPRITLQRNTLSKPQAKFATDKVHAPKYKIAGAASALIPKSLEPPKLKSAPTKSPLLHTQREPSSQKYIENTGSSKSTEKIIPSFVPPKFEDMKRLTMRKNIYPFKDTKIKISFSTTARPTSAELTFKSKQQFTTTPAPKIGKLRLYSESGRYKAGIPKIADAKEAPSDSNPSRIIALPTPNLKDIDNLPVISSTTRPSKGNELKQLPRTHTIDGNEGTVENTQLSKENSPLPQLVWPKITENSFLSKVREAVLSRLSSSDSAKPANDKMNKSSPRLDMLKSASEQSGIIVKGEPVLKENTSYKCRMICTRED